MSIEKQDLQVLAQLGYIAASRADVASAETIFAAVELERPASGAAFVGLALAYMSAGRTNDAVRTLDRGLLVPGQTDSAEIHAFRGVALQLAGRGAESLKALRQAGNQPLAAAMLGETGTVSQGA